MELFLVIVLHREVSVALILYVSLGSLEGVLVSLWGNPSDIGANSCFWCSIGDVVAQPCWLLQSGF